jgi:hypothetical protein
MGCSGSNLKENSSNSKQKNVAEKEKRNEKEVSKKGGSSNSSKKYNLNYYLDEASIYKVKDINEYDEILRNNEDVLVFCCKNDCPNCTMMEPIVLEKSLDHAGNLKVIKVKCEDIPEILYKDVNTETDETLLLPFIKLYKNNQFVQMVNGENDKLFEEMISSLNLDKDQAVLRAADEEELNQIKTNASDNNKVLIITAGQKYCPTCDYMLSRMLKIKALYKEEFVILKLDSTSQTQMCYEGIDYVKYPVDGIPIIKVYDRKGNMVGHVYGAKTIEFDTLVNKAYGKEIFYVAENNTKKISFNDAELPNRVVLSTSNQYQISLNGTYLHYPMSFNNYIYKNESNDFSMYWYESSDKRYGFWRFSTLDELQFAADPNSDRLGYGSYYAKYYCLLQDIFTDQVENDSDKFNMNFYWDHLPGGKKKQITDKIELADSSNYPKEIVVDCTFEDMSELIKNSCGKFLHHPVEFNYDVYLNTESDVFLFWYVMDGYGNWRTCFKKALNSCANPKGDNFGGGVHYIKYGCSLEEKYKECLEGQWTISFLF